MRLVEHCKTRNHSISVYEISIWNRLRDKITGTEPMYWIMVSVCKHTRSVDVKPYNTKLNKAQVIPEIRNLMGVREHIDICDRCVIVDE